MTTNPVVAAIQAMATAWVSIPPAMSGLRPIRSESPPVIQLAESPHGGVERGEHADAADRQPGVGEEDREQTPGEAVVEVVDEAGLDCTRTGPSRGSW